MYDFIHMDEKWFYLTRDKQQFLLADDKKAAQYCVCHKRHITFTIYDMLDIVLAHLFFYHTLVTGTAPVPKNINMVCLVKHNFLREQLEDS